MRVSLRSIAAHGRATKPRIASSMFVPRLTVPQALAGAVQHCTCLIVVARSREEEQGRKAEGGGIVCNVVLRNGSREADQPGLSVCDVCAPLECTGRPPALPHQQIVRACWHAVRLHRLSAPQLEASQGRRRSARAPLQLCYLSAVMLQLGGDAQHQPRQLSGRCGYWQGGGVRVHTGQHTQCSAGRIGL